MQVAIFIYGGSAQTPQELCEGLAGALCGSAYAVEPADDDDGGLLEAAHKDDFGASISPEEEDSDAPARAPASKGGRG